MYRFIFYNLIYNRLDRWAFRWRFRPAQALYLWLGSKAIQEALKADERYRK